MQGVAAHGIRRFGPRLWPIREVCRQAVIVTVTPSVSQFFESFDAFSGFKVRVSNEI
jgi:hypothetical protein